MSLVSKIHADIYPNGRVQLNPAAESKYKKMFIRDIVVRSLFFLLGGAFLLFAGYVSTHSFLATIMFCTYGVAFLALAIVKRTKIYIDKSNVKIIKDNKYNNWLIKIFKQHGSMLSIDSYKNLCRKHKILEIEGFHVNNKKVLEIVTSNTSYSVSKYAKLVYKKHEEEIDKLSRSLTAVGL